MQWLNPGAAWALLALAYLPLLYLLKRRHRDVPIPSSLLWRRALAEQLSNRPFQKMRRSLLLALQLLLALLLSLALMQPVFSGGAARELLLAFDLSAGMQADAGGRTRLTRALEHAAGVVSALPPGSRVSVVTAGRHTRQLLSRSSDFAATHRVLAGITAENGSADLAPALSLARAMAREAEGLETLFYTHAALEAEAGVFLMTPFEGVDNAAVLSLSAAGGQALCRVANYGGARTLTLSCYADGAPADAAMLSLGAGETGQVRFDVPADAVHLRAEILETDALPLDNACDFIIRSTRARRVVLAGEGNVFLESALTIGGDVELSRGSAREAALAPGYALYVFDGAQPDAPPPSGSLMLLKHGGAAGPGTLRRAPGALAERLTRGMPLKDVAVRAYTPLTAGTPLLLAGDDAVATLDVRDGRKIVRFGFDLHDSNLPVKLDFPLLIQNLLSELISESAAVGADAACGRDVYLTPDPRAASARLIAPSGAEYSIDGPGPFGETNEAGVYRFEQVVEGETRVDAFALNMPRGESETRMVPEGDNWDAATASGQGIGMHALAKLAALIALIVLMAEWWVIARGL
ncbi:MAG: VWA domain-containing protein [Eubacteriales bacterium]|nr:VWA domain-containing protein [Christensenellaceae bacterium]MEA5067292.1 VWA domain-containing protein [Eubacteriales bacterium]